MSTVTTSHALVRPARRFALVGAIVALASTGIVLIVLALASGGSSKSSAQPVRVLPASQLRQYPGPGVPRGTSAQSRFQGGSAADERQTPGQRP
jgi:hypothetical protein